MEAEAGYLDWPLLPDLFPRSFPGIQPCRDDVVVDIEHDRLVNRMTVYFNPDVSHEEMRRIAPNAMTNTVGFEAVPARDFLGHADATQHKCQHNIIGIMLGPT